MPPCDLNPQQASKLSDLLPHLHPRADWITELLVQGGFNGNTDSVLRACLADINNGAAEIVKPPSPATRLGRLLECAAICSRPGQQPSSSAGTKTNGTRTGVRQRDGDTLIADAVTLSEALRIAPASLANNREWHERLAKVARLWSDGWVLREAVAAVPHGADLSAIGRAGAETLLADIIDTEAQARSRKGDVAWWRQHLQTARKGPQQSHALISLLRTAHTHVVVELAG